MKFEHDARFRIRLFLFVGVAENGEDHSFHAERGLDDVRDIFFSRVGIGVFERFAAHFHVRFEVVIRPVRDAPEFTPTEGELEFEVGRGVGIEGEFFGIVIAQFEVFFLDAQAEQPIFAELFPIGEPFEVGAGLAEEFQLHLLEFSHAEDEVAGSDFVSEALAHLSDAEGDLHARRTLDVEEVDENALRGLGTQIKSADAVFRDALESLEHQVELPHAREVALAANGTGDLLFTDIIFHFGVVPAGDALFAMMLFHIIFDEIVRAVTGLAGSAIHERIAESADVTARDPNVGIHQNGAVDTRVESIFLHEFFPPGALYVVFQLDAERTVVPGVGETAVNFAAGINKAPAFAKGDQFVHCQLCHNTLRC